VPAVAQPSRLDCGAYFDAVALGNQNSPAILPERLLLDSDLAIPCIAMVMKAISRDLGPHGLSFKFKIVKRYAGKYRYPSPYADRDLK
jgi:hypothetical protein